MPGLLARQRPQANNEAAKDEEKLAGRLAVRFADRIEVLDPPSGERTSFPLPESLRGVNGLQAYQVSDDKLLMVPIIANPYNRAVELTWLDKEGKSAEQRTITLAGGFAESDREGATTAMAMHLARELLDTPMPAGVESALPATARASATARQIADELLSTGRTTGNPHTTLTRS